MNLIGALKPDAKPSTYDETERVHILATDF